MFETGSTTFSWLLAVSDTSFLCLPRRSCAHCTLQWSLELRKFYVRKYRCYLSALAHSSVDMGHAVSRDYSQRACQFSLKCTLCDCNIPFVCCYFPIFSVLLQVSTKSKKKMAAYMLTSLQMSCKGDSPWPTMVCKSIQIYRDQPLQVSPRALQAPFCGMFC